MGSSPIARSNFYFFLMAFQVLVGMFCLFPPIVFGQVSLDSARPFGMGGVVNLPQSSTYLGDLPHPIVLISNDFQSYTLGGIQVPLVGWSDLTGQSALGIHVAPPAVLFEGIPYPLNSTGSLNLLPFSGNAEIFNFPASAWWGNKSANGAVELMAPERSDPGSDRLSMAGGTQAIFNAGDEVENDFLGLDVNYRHGNSQVLGQTNTFNLISKEQWLKNNDVSIGSGFLGAHGLNGDDWYSAFMTFDLLGPNFQTLQFKPYFQTVQSGSQSLQETGGLINYLLNFAGLAESHIGMGIDKDSSPSIGLDSDNGFLQSTNLIDLLGNFMMDFAFRWDFSNVSNTTFSTILGMQGNLYPFVVMGDYDKGVMATTFQDVQQSDLGFCFQPGDQWNGTLKYVFEQVGNTPYQGGNVKFQWVSSEVLPWIYHFRVDLEEQVLAADNQSVFYDSGLTLTLGFTPSDQWWVMGRCLSGETAFLESGIAIQLHHDVKAYGLIENIGGSSVSLPDADQPMGTVITGGIQMVFK